jgi:hypothetical protein
MTKLLKKLLAMGIMVAAGALLCQTAALADIVTMTLDQPSTPAPYGVYVDPYPITVVASNPPSGLLQLSCDDYFTEIGVGLTWTANRFLLGQLGANTPKFSVSVNSEYSVQNEYDAAALLVVDMLQNPSNEVDDSYALWDIFSPTTPPSPPEGIDPKAVTLAGNELLFAKRAPPVYLYNEVYIYTPSPLTASQEFLGFVPEASTLAFLAFNFLVLLGVAIIVRKRITI